MKHAFKPLGIAAAVAAASASYVNVANAQVTVANNALGDLALVPYYTEEGDFITGIHLVNTSNSTQGVKFRFRRAEDSLDALDFNVVMSPEDVYAGFLSDDADGNIFWSADDTSCTVPATTDGRLQMPAIFRPGAETGYVEVILMGEPTSELEPIAIAAKHGSDGEPLDCEAVRSNFFAASVSVNNDVTIQDDTDLDLDDDDDTDELLNDYTDSGNALKVSYFIRDNASGIEFGDNAVHIQNFIDVPSITNQQFGFLSGDLNGFDFPDLDGTSPTGTNAQRMRFETLRSTSTLGVSSLINEWTSNAANGAQLDWVVTMPGQYTMVNLPLFIADYQDGLDGDDDDDWTCTRTTDDDAFIVSDGDDLQDVLDKDETVFVCDYRDIPVRAFIDDTIYNREEARPSDPEGTLTVSPAIPGSTPSTFLEKETNVITFNGGSVLGVSDNNINVTLGEDQPFGWAQLSVSSASGDQRVCNWIQPEPDVAIQRDGTCISVLSSGRVPMIGFAAWARQVAANPNASYGRIVAHSFTS